MRRRALLAIAATTVGCTTLTGGGPPEAESCEAHRYDGGGDGSYPWDLHIRNVSLSVHPVTIEVTALDTAERVVACVADSDSHREFDFGLEAGTRYRVAVTLARRDGPESAAIETRGGLGENEALEVTVEGGTFGIERVHVDPSHTPT